jgi:hypothetical protein
LLKLSIGHNRGGGETPAGWWARKGFGQLIDIDHAVLMVGAKHGRRVVMVIEMV